MEFDKRELSLQQLEGDAKFADKRGSVLVFLPGIIFYNFKNNLLIKTALS